MKPFIACGFCGVKILPVIGYNKHSRHILGVHANIITAVIAQLVEHCTGIAEVHWVQKPFRPEVVYILIARIHYVFISFSAVIFTIFSQLVFIYCMMLCSLARHSHSASLHPRV